MPIRIRYKKKIYDPIAMRTALQPVAQCQSLDEWQRNISPVIRKQWELGREEIKRRFFEKPKGETNAREQAWLMDQIIVTLFTEARTMAGSAPPMAVLAVGGYGRGTLSPYSDIDLLFLYDEADQDEAEQVVQPMLYSLWDLRLPVGHATRTVDETLDVASDDLTIATALLDARIIVGDQQLFDAVAKPFWQSIVAKNTIPFIEEKLAERDRRHEQMGESRYLLEPNVKDGKGGLRDLQTLWWIARHRYRIQDIRELEPIGILTPEEERYFIRSERLFLKTRAFMHYLAGRPEDILTFDLQQKIAEALGYRDSLNQRGVERFMKHYFITTKTVGNLTRTICAKLEEDERTNSLFSMPEWLQRTRKIDGFYRKGTRLTFGPDPDAFEPSAERFLQLFRTAQIHQMDPHPEALRYMAHHLECIDQEARKDAKCNAIFMEILEHSSPKVTTLRRMSDAGVLGRFVRDFGRVMGMMQFDMYHNFTVDEHTLNAVGILSAIENGEHSDEVPLASRLIHQIQLRRCLYLAVFLHDIAKGRGGNHSVLGEQVARNMGKRLGFSAYETETVAWLVRQHLLASHVAFRRDLNDPETIERFVAEVQSPERLKLLLILTVADIRAVGPTIWNGWKGALLRDLYNRAAAALGGRGAEDDIAQQVQSLKQSLTGQLEGWSKAAVTRYLGTPPKRFWLSFSLAQHHIIADCFAQSKTRGDLAIGHVDTHAFYDIMEVTLITPQRIDAFARLAGACAAEGLSIVHAKSFPLAEERMVSFVGLQSLTGETPKPEHGEQIIARLNQNLADYTPQDPVDFTLAADPREKKRRHFTVELNILISNLISPEVTVVEIRAKDRLGLLYHLCKALLECHVRIVSTHIATYGEKANDVIYIVNERGVQIQDHGELEALHYALSQTVAS